MLRLDEQARFERAVAGQLGGVGAPSDYAVSAAVHTALDHLGVALGRDVLARQGPAKSGKAARCSTAQRCA
jgi:hypothetical protein